VVHLTKRSHEPKIRGTFRNMKWSLLLSAAVAVAALPAAASAEGTPALQDIPGTQLYEVLRILQQNHVSGTSEEKLVDSAIQGMIGSLNDPYTVFMNKEQYQQFNDSLEQHFVGIGIRLSADGEGVYIAAVIPNSPAEAAGLKADDYIAAVDGMAADKLAPDQLAEKIVGKAGSSVRLTVRRAGQTLDFKVVRQAIDLPVVTSRLFDGGTGYIALSSFSDQADEQFAARLNLLESKGIQSLIIDLRDNGGGILDTALNIARLFIKEGTLIHTKNRDGKDEPVTFSGGQTVPFTVTVLVNENSASASEVLAGALQDYQAARIVGTQTYGKGSVQTIYQLSGGAVLKVTIEEYLTPKLRTVNKIGIQPDVEVDGSLPQLITALRQGKAPDELTLAIGKHDVLLNNAQFSEPVPVIRRNSDAYVPSRVVAALLGARVKWDGELQAVELSSPQGTESFAAADGSLINVEGTAYLSLTRLQSRYSQLHGSDDGSRVSIHVTKE